MKFWGGGEGKGNPRAKPWLYYLHDIEIRLTLSHLKGSRENQRKNLKKNISCRWGIKPRNPGLVRALVAKARVPGSIHNFPMLLSRPQSVNLVFMKG